MFPNSVIRIQQAFQSEDTDTDEIIKIIKDFALKNLDLKIIRAQKWAASAFPGGKATKGQVLVK